MTAHRLFGPLLAVLAFAARATVHVDDAGRAVDFAQPPQRVVTLAPNLTEFVYAVGAGATLVGTMDTSNFPEDARRVPRIGDYQRLDVERILALKPDVILVWHHGNQGRELGQLEAAGLKLFYLEPKRLDDVPATLERVGALLGRDAAARPLAAAWRADLAALRRRHANAAPVSVFFQVWSQPLMTLNGQHLTSDILALCGGRNVFAALSALAPQVSLESVVAADPEVILSAREYSPDPPLARREPGRKAFVPWQSFRRITAVRRGWMYTVPGDLLTRQGPRVLDGVRAVCEALDQVRLERRTVPSR
jgi:iron complex transport system substrate-binding protein